MSDIVEPTDVLKPLADRMGAAEFKRRVKLETHLKEKAGKIRGRGLFRLERWFNLYGFIEGCLRFTGLWRRAHRNYFAIQVDAQEWTFDRLPRAFDGFRILHLTDLHTDLHPDFADAVIGALRGLEYDYAVVTGDFRACTYSDHTGATAESIRILRSLKTPVLLTLGNHDSICKVPEFEAAGFPFLLNEQAIVERGGERLHFVGIDDPNHYKSHCFERALRQVPADAFKVLLSHSPETFREAALLGFDFMLSGHTHGGQLCLPFGIPVVHDGSAPRRLLAGRWSEANLQGYTGRGTGATGLPVRLNCPAEATIHTLRRR